MKKTLVLGVDSFEPDTGKIKIAAGFIRRGGLVAFPTETVYGLGVNALDAKAVLKVFRAKRRPLDNPPIVHICEANEIFMLARSVPSEGRMLMERFWPGPLTLILKRSVVVPGVTVAGLDTIAIRMPRNNVALALIRESGCPIAAPSANLAGKPSPTCAKHVLDDLGGRIDVVLNAGPTRIGVESTVLDLTVDPPEVLRPGGVSVEDLRSVLGRVVLSPVAVADRALSVRKVRSPGVSHKHYAPKAEVIVVEGDVDAVAKRVNELVRSYKKMGRKVGVLAVDESMKCYDADDLKSLGSRSDLSSVARSLFGLLREFDADGVDVIVAESVPLEGLGLAVMNRLRRAAGFKIVKA